VQRASRQRLGWVVAVLALLALAAWQWRHDASAEPGSVLDLAPEQVTRIALGIGGAQALHYAKRDGHWWQTDGTPRRADDGRLAELAATAAAPVLSWRAASDFDPARIGLTPPQAVLSLDGRILEFGSTAATGAQRYVRVGQRIALLPEHYSPRPPTGKVRELDR
jgi:hypothetical protein